MSERIYVCGCERSHKIKEETVLELQNLLQQKQLNFTYVEDLCGSIIHNPQDLISIKENKKSIIIGCQPRAMQHLLDYAVFCTCGTELEFHHSEKIIEDGINDYFSKTSEASNKVANALLRLGLSKGDRVALLLSNSPEFVIIYFGIVKSI